MAKSLIIVMIALAVVSMADPFAEIKNIIRKDECQISKMEEIKPKIEQQLQLLKEVHPQSTQNKNDFNAKTELIGLVQQAKAVYNECDLDNKVQPALGDVVEATGIAFLLASNCSKDVGIVFLLADSIIQVDYQIKQGPQGLDQRCHRQHLPRRPRQTRLQGLFPIRQLHRRLIWFIK